MTHPMQAAEKLPDETVMALVDRLFDRWNLDELTRRQLLSNHPGLLNFGQRESPSTIERGRQLLTIHAGLQLLFPEDLELRWRWVTCRNRALNGSTPLEVMLASEVGVARVVQLIRQDVGT